MIRAATMEIPINSNGDTESTEELEQDLQQVMVSGPNLNDSSVVSGGYGGVEGIISTGSIAGPAVNYNPDFNKRIPVTGLGPSMHHSGSSSSVTSEQPSRGVAVEKLETVKQWGLNTYKCTKQLLSERFGGGSRTVDPELESQIQALRDTKRKYENLLRLARALTNHFYNLVQTQHNLGDAFAELSQKSPELRDEFGVNAETQKLLCRNGETLLGDVNYFLSSVNTLVNKTMEDTLATIRSYENARLEFDAYRSDLEVLSLGPRDAVAMTPRDGVAMAPRDVVAMAPRDPVAMARMDAAQQQFQVHKEKYERLRSDVIVKLKFLEENKVKVMHKQLLLFHNAVSSYFAGNQQQLQETMAQFNVRLRPPGGPGGAGGGPSWLEEQ
ncbi:arfaptin-2-like isoform X3 [Cololabis saira]|uniref:arfaptin-2-like isoform X3 n=1 Tax=Cololabis saira TaxID=129043 RepID=UPI002AD55338|nr:arfaptin-2-like isoform X3 [Cololabis saira]